MSRQSRRSPVPQPRAQADASEALFRTTANEMPIMLWLCAPDGLSTFVNKAWLQFTGRTMARELGRGWLTGVHEGDIAGIRERFREARDHQAPFALEYRLMRADGQYRWLLGHGSPRFARNGALLDYVGS